jgi:putative nucleotidyltransferase with HDIG domain
MRREAAWKLLNEMMQNKNLIRHGLAVESIMKSLCIYLKEKHPELPKEEFNEEEWGIVGLLHDADYELIGKDLEKHTLVTAEKLRELGVSERIIEGVRAHHWGVKPTRDNIMEKAVFCADDISGLITACALVQPEKKLATVTVESVLKKIKNPSFAKGAKREQILASPQELDLPTEQLVTIALKAMQDISSDIGL